MGARRHAARRQRHSEGLVIEGERRQPLQHVDRGTQPVGHRGHHRTERRRRDGHLRRPRGERRHHHHHQERPPQPGDARQRLGIAIRDRPSRPLAPQPDERLAEGRSGAGAGGERPTQLPAGHGRRSPHPGQGRGAPGARQRRKPRIALPETQSAIGALRRNGTDWGREIYRTALNQQYSVSISGGSGKTGYYFSGGYYNEQERPSERDSSV